MDDSSMLLVRISASADGKYTATLVESNGTEKDYEFIARSGKVEVIESSPEFADEVGFYGRSDVIYKAVSAFHEARKHFVGRPTWLRKDELNEDEQKDLAALKKSIEKRKVSAPPERQRTSRTERHNYLPGFDESGNKFPVKSQSDKENTSENDTGSKDAD